MPLSLPYDWNSFATQRKISSTWISLARGVVNGRSHSAMENGESMHYPEGPVSHCPEDSIHDKNKTGIRKNTKDITAKVEGSNVVTEEQNHEYISLSTDPGSETPVTHSCARRTSPAPNGVR
ncbi:hypothetical protein PIB30_059767 [Stylosanthes scabra]|uniref:Uncharacterized protein n=1 Tax=Stylosanthes scabra TaxID=79078 RepID=A0ABU6QKZ9_9FABA|nr:hypothetical protein [Stylosanthes scabra]